MGHGLFAVNVLSRAAGIHHDLLVPVVGHGGHDAIDLLVGQKFLIAPGDRNRFAYDFLCQFDASIIKIAGSHALDARQLDRGGKQAGALHSDTDHAETYRVAGWKGLGRSWNRLGLKHDRTRRQREAGCTR